MNALAKVSGSPPSESCSAAPSDRGRRLVRSRGRGGCLGDRRPGPHRAVLLAGQGATRCRTRGSRWQRGGVRERVAVRRRGGGLPRGSTVMYDPEPGRSRRAGEPIPGERCDGSSASRASTASGPCSRPRGASPTRSAVRPVPAVRLPGDPRRRVPAAVVEAAVRPRCLPSVREVGWKRAASPLIVQLTVIWEDPCVTPKVVRNAWRPRGPGRTVRCGRPGDPQGLEALRLIAAAQG